MFSITEIAEAVQGKIEGDPNLRIKGVRDIQDISMEPRRIG